MVRRPKQAVGTHVASDARAFALCILCAAGVRRRRGRLAVARSLFLPGAGSLGRDEPHRMIADVTLTLEKLLTAGMQNLNPAPLAC